MPSDPVPGQPLAQAPSAQPALFASRSPQKTPLSPIPWLIAGSLVLALLGVLLLTGHRARTAAPLNRILPLDPYASSLTLDNLQMSESTSLSGGKSTFIDGHVRNSGNRTLTAATVQILFANDEAAPPQVETLHLTLIRTREPYVDTQPLAATPLAPGQEREFRLIFENIGSNWNQQLPRIHVVHVSLQ